MKNDRVGKVIAKKAVCSFLAHPVCEIIQFRKNHRHTNHISLNTMSPQ